MASQDWGRHFVPHRGELLTGLEGQRDSRRSFKYPAIAPHFDQQSRNSQLFHIVTRFDKNTENLIRLNGQRIDLYRKLAVMMMNLNLENEYDVDSRTAQSRYYAIV